MGKDPDSFSFGVHGVVVEGEGARIWQSEEEPLCNTYLGSLKAFRNTELKICVVLDGGVACALQWDSGADILGTSDVFRAQGFPPWKVGSGEKKMGMDISPVLSFMLAFIYFIVISKNNTLLPTSSICKEKQ